VDAACTTSAANATAAADNTVQTVILAAREEVRSDAALAAIMDEPVLPSWVSRVRRDRA